MKLRLFLALALPTLLCSQGITVNDPSKSWAAIVTEPPIPKVTAGQSFVSFYGHKVTRITDSRSGPGNVNWMHYYSDRSPLSRNSRFLTIYGGEGTTYIQPMTDGMPSSLPYIVYDQRAPTIVGSSYWSPIDDELLYFIGDNVQLWSINARTRRKKMHRDFSKELSKGMIKEGILRLNLISSDGKRFVMDYARMNKEIFGAILYDISTNTARAYHGDRVAVKSPAANNPAMRLAGVGAEKSGEFLFMQENGEPINPKSPNPLEYGNTFTYFGKWEDGPLAKGVSFAGVFPIGHGASVSKGHIRATYESAFRLSSGDALFSLRRTDLTKAPDPEDRYRIPYRDIFFWPFSSGSGVHLSASSWSDDWLALSLYQEGSCGQRVIAPLAGEILMVSTKGETEFDPATQRLVKNGEIQRLTHHYSYPEDCTKAVPYWSQPRAALSTDGKYVVYSSSFGRTGRTDVFVLHLPKNLVPGQ